MYICAMKENYNHENRHKYYLKCHLIFCIKYRRKILKYLKEIIMLNSTKEGIVVQFLPEAKDFGVSLNQVL